MKIIGLQAENLKRLTAVDIRPDGHLVEITGRNGQGKTSVLDAIWWALEGTKHIQAQPIRKGATEAMIRLDLGTLKVTRKFKAKDEGGYTTSIMVENEDGARFGSPQTMLDALVGELSFDPLEFTRKDAKGQFDSLKRLVPGVDFDAIDVANKADFTERSEVNRRAKELRAQAAGFVVAADLPADPINVRALVDEQSKAGEHNAEIERLKAAREAYAADTGRLNQEAVDKRAKARALREEADGIDAEATALEVRVVERVLKTAQAPALGEPIDTTAIGAKIMAANAVNEAVADAKRRASIEAEAKVAETRSEALTKAMADRNADKQKAVAAAKMPVDGLEFGDGVILLGGVPFDQGSDAEQLRASIGIAAAMNPKLRVIRVRDGSLLDPESLALVGEFAAANDLQVWVETVASGRPGAVLIEDGHVVGAAAPVLHAAE